MFDIKGFINQSRRVMSVATLPRQKEFGKIVQTTAVGVIIIGLVGVILSVVLNVVQ